MDFIACDDRLPECFGYYLVFMDNPIHSAINYAVASFDKYGFSRARVTHWMPLPESPIKVSRMEAENE